MTPDETLRLLRTLLEAAGDPAAWQGFVTELSAAVNSPHTGIWVQRLDRHPPEFSPLGLIGFDPAGLVPYGQHYASRNIYLLHGGHKLTPGAVLFDEELCPRQIVRKSEFFNDWMRHQKM